MIRIDFARFGLNFAPFFACSVDRPGVVGKSATCVSTAPYAVETHVAQFLPHRPRERQSERKTPENRPKNDLKSTPERSRADAAMRSGAETRNAERARGAANAQRST